MSMQSGFKMTFVEYKANFFSEVDTGLKRDLSRLGAYCKTVARNSIKTATKLTKKQRSNATWRTRSSTGRIEPYSQPGNPPLSKTGLLKKFIFFAWDDSSKSAVIGPAKFKKGDVPAVLEYGGSVPVTVTSGKTKRLVNVHIAARPYMGPALKETQKYLGNVMTGSFGQNKFNNAGDLLAA